MDSLKNHHKTHLDHKAECVTDFCEFKENERHKLEECKKHIKALSTRKAEKKKVTLPMMEFTLKDNNKHC
jgi:hypothetical protein